MKNLTSALCFSILCALTLSAQSPIYTLSEATPAIANNYPQTPRLVPVGDANGDGVADFAIPDTDHTWRLRSGATGVQIGVVGTPITTPVPIREAIGLGDVNGDGLGDLAIVEGMTLRLYPTGQTIPLWSRPLTNFIGTFGPQFPEPQLARLGDVDGDGIDDIAIGIRTITQTIAFSQASGPGGVAPPLPPLPPGAPLPTAVDIISGATGATIITLAPTATTPRARFVAAAGDMNGDGLPDLLVQSHDGAGGTTVWAHDAQTGLVITTYAVPAIFASGNMVGDFDLDGDGTRDFCIGVPQDGLTGAVHAFSGVDGSQIASVLGDPGDAFGHHPRLGDHDGDGVLDVAAVAFGGNFPGGHVRVGSFASGRLLADTRSTGLIFQAAHLEDLDGDGLDELIAAGSGFVPQGSFITAFPGRRGLGGAAAGNTSLPEFGEDLLLVSGSAGDGYRRVDLAVGESFDITMEPLPIAPTLNYSYAVFAFLGVPVAADAFDLGGTGGTMTFIPAPLLPAGVPVLLTLATNLGGLAGTVALTGPAPTALGIPAGIPAALDLTIQALVLEPGDVLRKTNGILVSVR